MESSASTHARTLVTSALPYANGPLHLGHLAGAYLPADVYVRYLRAVGKPVLWVCGSDEHGAAISMRAKREGRSEQSIIDTYHELNKAAFAQFGIAFDIYHRTSSPLHHDTSRELFEQLIKKGGQFEERTSEQYYDAEADAFLADRFIQGTCPHCSFPDAFGDQCENCGKDLSPQELIQPRSTISGATPELRSTKHWYFRLDEHEAWLKQYIEYGRLTQDAPVGSHHNPTAWRNHVTGQCKSWLEAGLQPRAFTRDLDWGIQVPTIPGHITESDAEGKVLYVWFDAPIGYISATKAYLTDPAFAKTRKARGHEGHHWEQYWKSPTESRLIHFIGKDNIVFHCLTFQATLRALGDDWTLAYNVPANQFLNFEGEKFSKSRGIGITMDEYLEEFKTFPNHVDAMRWALLRGAPENKDADFTWDDFINYHDKELADKLGNFVNRVVVLTHKYFDGKVPSAAPGDEQSKSMADFLARMAASLDGFELKQAASEAIALLDWANTDLQDRAPWKLYKANPDDPSIAESLYIAAQAAGLAAVLFDIFLPNTAQKIRTLFGGVGLSLAQAAEQLASGKSLVPAGTVLAAPELLFAKIHDRKDGSRLQLIQRQQAKLATALAEATQEQAAQQHVPVKPEVVFDDFTKLDVRTGNILTAEKMPKADKLLKLEVDLGFEQRTIVSGIAKHFQVDELPGQEVLVLVNLAPRKLRGVESQGMILMAEDADGSLQFVAPSKSVRSGSPVA